MLIFCTSRYGSYPLKGKHCHEMALRILLACIEVRLELVFLYSLNVTITGIFFCFFMQSHAIHHKRYIVPIISVHLDFYIRVFVQIFTLSPAYTFRWRIPSLGFMLFVQFWLFFTAHNTFTSVPSPCSSASTVKSSPLKLAHVYQCTGCSSFHLQNIGRINSKVVFSILFHCLAWCAYGYNPFLFLQDKRNIALPNFSPLVPQECAECGHNFVMGGPIWSDPMHDKEWAASILSSIQAMSCAYSAYAKISAIMTSISEVMPIFLVHFALVGHILCTLEKIHRYVLPPFQVIRLL